MLTSLNKIKEKGCVFYVGGRISADKIFHELKEDDFDFNEKDIKNLFIKIPGYRVDISSTELRSNSISH